MTKSALQIARAAYQPKLPKALKGGVKVVEGEPTQSVADQEEIKKLFPNNEVKNGFVSLVASNYLKPEENLNGWIRDVVRALRQGDTESLRGLFTSFLAGIPYTMRSKHEKERYFHYTFYLIFRLISVYTVYTEKEQSQGRSDCIVETPDYVYIFEFKRDGSADEALAQIEAKGYARPYEADPRTIYKIGVNFSSETGTVEEWKVC